MTAHHAFPRPLTTTDILDHFRAADPDSLDVVGRLLDLVAETRGTTFTADGLDGVIDAFEAAAVAFAEHCQEQMHEQERRNPYDWRE